MKFLEIQNITGGATPPLKIPSLAYKLLLILLRIRRRTERQRRLYLSLTGLKADKASLTVMGRSKEALFLKFYHPHPLPTAGIFFPQRERGKVRIPKRGGRKWIRKKNRFEASKGA